MPLVYRKKAEVEIQVGAESITKDPSSKIAETETAEAMEQVGGLFDIRVAFT